MGFTSTENVYEVSIGDGKVQKSRRGQLALVSPAAKEHFAKMRVELWQSKLDRHEFVAKEVVTQKSSVVGVSVTFHILFNGQDYEQQVKLSSDGRWEPKAPHHPIDLEKDDATRGLCIEIADNVQGIMEWTDKIDKRGEEISPEKLVLRQIKTVLQADIKAANDKLLNEMVQLMMTEDFRGAAHGAYEDFVRDQVHEALELYMKVGPDALHRFVDELFCKKIHDE